MLDDATLKQLTENVKTPFYVYDAELIRKNIKAVNRAFEGVSVHFSLKSNPCPAVSAVIARAGAQAEIASPFEARIAATAGFSPENILYDGPGKTLDNIREVLSLGVKRFNIESMTELERLKQVAGEDISRLTVCFRVNPLDPSNAAEKMTGKPSRFGIDIEKFTESLEVASAAGVNISGIHLYLGSQILSEQQLIDNYEVGLKLLRNNIDKLKDSSAVEYVFGCGFGIPYSNDESELDLKMIADGFERLRQEYDFCGNLITRFELGRYIIANAGKYLAEVSDVKISRGEKFITLSGGVNHFMRYVMTGAKHRVRRLGKECLDFEHAEVCGQTCTPYDVLTQCNMPADIAAGDIIVLDDAGAYGWSMGIQNFLSFPSCAEILLDNGKFDIVRRKGSFEDIIELCSIPE